MKNPRKVNNPVGTTPKMCHSFPFIIAKTLYIQYTNTQWLFHTYVIHLSTCRSVLLSRCVSQYRNNDVILQLNPDADAGSFVEWRNSLWVRRTLFRRLSRDGSLGGSGMSHATTASWSAKKNGQHQRVDISAHTRTVYREPSAEKTGRGSLLNRPSYSLPPFPDDPTV